MGKNQNPREPIRSSGRKKAREWQSGDEYELESHNNVMVMPDNKRNTQELIHWLIRRHSV